MTLKDQACQFSAYASEITGPVAWLELCSVFDFAQIHFGCMWLCAIVSRALDGTPPAVQHVGADLLQELGRCHLSASEPICFYPHPTIRKKTEGHGLGLLGTVL